MTATVEPPFRASRYTTGAIVLHWTIAALILVQILGGWAMHEFLESGTALQFNAYQLHKSLGITVLVLTVARIAWRLFNPPPAEPPSVTPLERRVSGVVHATFYALLVLIPLSGWIMITVSPIRVETVLFFQSWLPWPDVPGLGVLRGPTAAGITEEVHAILAYATGVLLLLHVAGAVKHHLADGAFIARMSPFGRGDGPRNAYGHATTAVVTLLFAGVIVGSAAVARYGVPDATLARTGVSPDQAEVLAAAATADAASAPSETAVAERSPLWIVRPDESELTFSAQMMGSEAGGTFGDWDATIRFDPDDLADASVEVRVGTDAVELSGDALTPSQVAGPDGFANAEHGVATFRSDAIRPADDGEGYLAEGTLTIRGTQAPLTLPFSVEIDGDVARAAGSADIARLTYGIGASNDPGGETLGVTVGVAFEVVADRPSARTDAANAVTD